MGADRKIIVAVTGASGAILADRLIAALAGAGCGVHLMVSAAGELVTEHELGKKPEELWRGKVAAMHDVRDFTAPPASGSAGFSGMAVVPCTMGSLAAIAGGVTKNLIHRAADVVLKERKRLVLAVRETPLNRIHLQNMLAAHDAGAVICPPLFAFYHRPADIREAADHFAARVAALLGVEIPDMPHWGEGDQFAAG